MPRYIALRSRILLAGASTLGALSLAGLARAEAAADRVGTATVGEVVVTSDKAGLLERRPSSTVFGLDKPLIDTPRSASLISDHPALRHHHHR